MSACGPGSSAADGDASSGDESGEVSTGDEPGTASCPSADPSFELQFRIVGGGSDDEFSDAACIVAEVEVRADGFDLALDCDDDIELVVDRSPGLAPALAPGADVLLTSMVTDEFEGTVRSIFVHDASTGVLEIAAVRASSAAWTDELTPLQLTPIPDACAPGPDASNCLEGRRQMWNASDGNQHEVVGSDLHSQLGAYDVRIAEAFVGELLECVDIAPSIYHGIIVRTQ
jgi:hypothetical protein